MLRPRPEGALALNRLGALPVDGGLTEFRVWAPNATAVAVGGHALEEDAERVFIGIAPVRGTYWYEVDGRRLPDPLSRSDRKSVV